VVPALRTIVRPASWMASGWPRHDVRDRHPVRGDSHSGPLIVIGATDIRSALHLGGRDPCPSARAPRPARRVLWIRGTPSPGPTFQEEDLPAVPLKTGCSVISAAPPPVAMIFPSIADSSPIACYSSVRNDSPVFSKISLIVSPVCFSIQASPSRTPAFSRSDRALPTSELPDRGIDQHHVHRRPPPGRERGQHFAETPASSSDTFAAATSTVSRPSID